MFNVTADFFSSIFIPLFKVAGVIFILIGIVLGSVIVWQKLRERKEYREYLESQE